MRRRSGCWWSANQISCQRRQSIVLPFCPAILDRHILALGEAGFAQALTKGNNGALANGPGDALWRKPTTGIAVCCARAITGHTAAPPTSVMNSRLFN